MTSAVGHPVPLDTVSLRRPALLLPEGWPLTVALAGYPLSWVLGLGPVCFLVAALPMAAHLARRRRLVVPRGWGWWLFFLGWVLVTAVGLDTPGRALAFTYRFSQFATAGVILVYTINLGSGFRKDHVRDGLLVLFGATVLSGALAQLVPMLEVPSLSLAVLPGALTSDEFVRVLFTPNLADVQTFLGFPLARPVGPFEYSNTWGAAYAILLPWVLADILTPRSRRRRRWALVLLVVSVAPALISVNRSMWGAVVVALATLVFTARGPRLRRAATTLAFAVPVLALVVATSPLGSLVQDRLETPHSNNARSNLAVAAVDATLSSPLIGHGSPRTYEGPGIRPPVGTQGLLWFIMFSHGLPALVAFVAFFVAMWRNVRGSPDAVWLRMSMVAALVMFPFYNMMTVPFMVVVIMTGLAIRDVQRATP